ncbi:hypothetical protein CC86DRAFT_367973 [Ophiobolus disseminans]|uniref:Uncharacterized protein n=1 Tax=Ophiobolus disseminans TaxID=1469910 RepID=A0A6A7ABY5_9PLEO|nr:hypothetical protein CC86DRAFT_367973 [Ophiobolus disseminans]
MPRKMTKSASTSTPRSSSKRPAQDTPSRQSKRARAAARKSYAEPDTDDGDEVTVKKAVSATDGDDVSEAFGFDDASDGEASSESEQEDVTSDEDGTSKKATRRGKSTKKSLPIHKKSVDEKELWKTGAKLAPGTQLIIKKPKAREAGDTPFTDETIHPNTMLFLKDLAANNDRQWLKLHDPDFRAAFQDFTTFTEKVSEKVVEADELIPELPVKDVIYRIYRDIRFSKDPTPYKTYFSAAWSRTGRKGPYAHYYVQIQPGGGSFVGGGFWQPEAATLAKLRRDIDRKPHKIKNVLNNTDIRRVFLRDVADNEKKAVQAFTNLPSNKSNALKRHPKGYDQNHIEIELLRLRNFTLGTKVPDREVVGPGGLNRVAELVACLVPFISYLNSVVMPDEDPSDSSENDEDDEDSNRGEH